MDELMPDWLTPEIAECYFSIETIQKRKAWNLCYWRGTSWQDIYKQGSAAYGRMNKPTHFNKSPITDHLRQTEWHLKK